MKLEINLKNIQEIAQLKKDENLSFRNFLKLQDYDKVDAIVQRLDKEITPRIDCMKCGNCCLNLRPIASAEVLSKFVEEKDIRDFMYLLSFPCTHVKDKKCTKYLDRPDECREYPYLDKTDFVSRIVGMLLNYELCPIVFNVIEYLKIELGWRYK